MNSDVLLDITKRYNTCLKNFEFVAINSHNVEKFQNDIVAKVRIL